jgi:DNA-binding transcriptional MerR regulator
MRMADLSRRSGVSIASIKFYQREGLLQPGHRTAPNQATYSEIHVRRLRLIRALRDIAGLGIETIRKILATLDDPDQPLFALLGAVTNAVLEADGPQPQRTAAQVEAEAAIERLFGQLGWEVSAGSAARSHLADTFIAFRETCLPGATVEMLIPYAKAVESLARFEVEFSMSSPQPRQEGVSQREATEAALEIVVAGTILGEQAMTALRRAAHEHFCRLLLGGGTEPRAGER